MTAPGADAPLILVVDDNPLNVEPLTELLRAMGYRTAAAMNGEAALLRTRELRPDLILLDIMMPGMNGMEVCRRLKADPRSLHIPVVFVTALSDTSDKIAAIEAGGDDFLTKPYNRPVLLARIRSLLRLKEARDGLETSYRQLQTLEKLKDDLMGMIVHDLRSPLTSVMGTLEIVLDGDVGELNDEQSSLLGDALKRGEDLLHLIDDLLELAQLEESKLVLQLQQLSVDELLESVREDWALEAQRAGAGLAITEAGPISMRADPRLLRRVLGNLVSNALQHADRAEGGLEIRLAAVPAPVPEGLGSTPSVVWFSVADNGVGIPEAYQELIFQKFGSLGLRGGRAGPSGLGLTFCKLAVEAHGGRIWVQSRPREGSVFHFVIPRGSATANPSVA